MRQVSTVFAAMVFFTVACTQPQNTETSTVREILASGDLSPLKSLGDAALPEILGIYEGGNSQEKATAAQALYFLGIKSERARELLMQDVHTTDESLRLQVQWALGRVSNDDLVVRTLLENMRNDPNPLFRDKAACALASDQIHLTENQRLLLLRGLAQALDDEKEDVRNIARKALEIQTGQDKGSRAADWTAWLDEYQEQLGGGR